MKRITKLLILGILSTSLVLASGCKKTADIGNQIINDTKKSYDNAANEVKKVSDKATQTVNNIQDAAKKIQAANDAVQKIGK